MVLKKLDCQKYKKQILLSKTKISFRIYKEIPPVFNKIK